MEDARASISSRRPESFPTGNNRNIPVSVQELVYGSKATGVGTSSKSLDRHNELISSSEEVNGPIPLRVWTPMSFKGQVQQIKAWLKNQCMLSEDQKKMLAQGKENSQVEAPKASTRTKPPQQVPKKPKKTQKTNKNDKQKAKPKWNKPYPQNYSIPKKEKKSMDNVFNMERTLM
ncbi:hypothetical protein O181_048537 [Austropuccinia psidii MF-1]|uniref:Uncharacterized protein n=1 Tax=Austropuccinia psidii MF-1 TaxID=1389203 RepID=A0A9Q3DVA4_9BASI|nr:hypothetical protein [Austropuccinia psidii MF-1]